MCELGGCMGYLGKWEKRGVRVGASLAISVLLFACAVVCAPSSFADEAQPQPLAVATVAEPETLSVQEKSPTQGDVTTAATEQPTHDNALDSEAATLDTGDAISPSGEKTVTAGFDDDASSGSENVESAADQNMGDFSAEKSSDDKQAADDSHDEGYTVENVYRLYNSVTSEHLFTTSRYEYEQLPGMSNGDWVQEGVAWLAPQAGDPVFRLYNTGLGDHHYTRNGAERDQLVQWYGWISEGVAFYSAPSDDGIAIYRVYNGALPRGQHHYTRSYGEQGVLTSKYGWSDEGVGWYAVGSLDNVRVDAPDGWLVTDELGQGFRRYWVEGGKLAMSKLITPDAGKDAYWAYATDQGYVLTNGSMSVGTEKITADNDGRLFANFAASIPDENGKLSKVVSSIIEGTTYLFLPSYARLAESTLDYSFLSDVPSLEFAADEHGVFAAIASGSFLSALSALSPSAQDGAFKFVYRYQDGFVRPVIVMQSSSLKTMYLVSDDPIEKGRSFIEASRDHSAKATGSMLLAGANGEVVYDGALAQIKGRGNTTWINGNKKPYQIKLEKKTNLLDSGGKANKAKTWVLLANASDVTLLHNQIASNLAQQLGLTFSPEMEPIDLYYDGEYRGSYLLSEKVEIGSGRVDIYDLEKSNEKANEDVDTGDFDTAKAVNSHGYEFQYVKSMRTPTKYDGGYLLELDSAYYSSERSWFSTSVGVFVVKSPEDCSYEEMKYISEYVQDALDSLGGADAAAFWDIDSAAKMYLLNEYTKNVDWGYSSTYYYLPSANDAQGHKLFAGPAWDFDSTYGTRDDAGVQLLVYNGLYTEYLNRSMYLINNLDVQSVARNEYLNHFYDLAQELLGKGGASSGQMMTLDELAERIASSQKMNEALFGLSTFSNCLPPYETYEKNLGYLRWWLENRSEWMLGQVKTWNGSKLHNAVTSYDGVDFALVYDYSYYLEKNPDVRAAFGGDEYQTLMHFIRFGMNEGRIASRNFDVDVYRSRYSDLSTAFGADLAQYYRHYITYGFYEGRGAV